MKFGFKIKDINLGEIRVGEIEVNTELSINEMVAIRKESEIMLEKMPTYLDQFKVAMDKVVEIDNSMTEQEVVAQSEKQVVESIIESFKNKLSRL